MFVRLPTYNQNTVEVFEFNTDHIIKIDMTAEKIRVIHCVDGSFFGIDESTHNWLVKQLDHAIAPSN